jgi:hypothetical protein
MYNSKFLRLVISPIEVGIAPEILLKDKSRILNSFMLSILVGITPSIFFV